MGGWGEGENKVVGCSVGELGVWLELQNNIIDPKADRTPCLFSSSFLPFSFLYLV